MVDVDIVVEIIFLFILLIYIISLIQYLTISLCSKHRKLCVYWCDFIFTIIVLITSTIVYLTPSSTKPKEDTDTLNISTLSMCVFIYIISTNSFMNCIKCVLLSFKVNRFYTLDKTATPETLLTSAENINIVSIYNTLHHIIQYVICLIVNGGVIYALHLVIIIPNESESDKNKFNIMNNVYIVIPTLIEMLLMMVLCSKYQALTKLYVNSKSFVNQKILIKTRKKISLVIEHLLYKILFDFVLKIAIIPDINNNRNEYQTYKAFKVLIRCFIYILYIIFSGSLFLTIDYKNGNFIPSCTGKCFFLSHFKYQFNLNNKQTSLYKPIKLNMKAIQSEASSLLDDSNVLYQSTDSIGDSNYPNSFTSNTQLSNTRDAKIKNISRKGYNKDESISVISYMNTEEKEYLPCNFYMLYKILYMYYKRNEKIFLNVEKMVEDEGIPFKQVDNLKSQQTQQDKRTARIDNINRISRISISHRSKVTLGEKFTLQQLMNSINDKIIQEEFIKHLVMNVHNVNNNNNDNINNNNKYLNNDLISSINNKIQPLDLDEIKFTVESLFREDLFELFPFYQINIGDVLHSLEIGNNKKLCEQFYKEKEKDPLFNDYYTKDMLLKFEIYDKNAIKVETMRTFIKNYKEYLLTKLTNFSYTFLPLIIGVFNVNYLSYNKIVILYRNPLSFSPLFNFNYWLTFCFTDNTNTDKTISSSKVNEALDLNEIEVKNNVVLNEDEYNETESVLTADLEFMKAQGYEMDCKLNLFVLNDVNKNESTFNFEKSGEQISNANVQQDGGMDVNNKFENLLRDTNLFGENVVSNVKKARKFFGSDVVSLLEKIFLNNVVENKYVFKVYFSEVFKIKGNGNGRYKRDGNEEEINERNVRACRM